MDGRRRTDRNVGRDDEQRELAAVLEAAAAGRASGVMVLGEAGIGKTSILRWTQTVANERGFTTLETVGINGGVPSPHVGLQELLLCSPVLLDEFDESGLLAAVVDGTVSVSAPRIAAAFLDGVTRLAERTPLLVVVDDAHWIDGPTLTAIATLARRAEIDRIAVVASSRTPVSWWAATGLSTMELRGLSEGAAVRLLHDVAYLDAERARECWLATGGNPLAMIELGPRWKSSKGAMGARLSPRLEGAIDERLAGVDTEVAEALLLIALDLGVDVRRVALVTAPSAIDRAVAAGLLERSGGSVRFVHPLVRSRVSGRASSGEIRLAHRKLADVADRVGDREGSVWHRAEAATEPDEQLAVELSGLGQTLRRRGAMREWLFAAERSSQLSVDRDEAGWRLADAVEAAWFLGEHVDVERLYGDVRRLTSAPRVRGKLAMAYGQEVTWRDGPLAGYRFLSSEAEAIADDAPSQAAICAAFAASAATMGLRVDLALATAQRALAIAQAGGDAPAQLAAQCALGNALQLVGDQDSADRLLGPVEQLAVVAAEAGMTEAEHLVVYVFLSHGYAERWDRCRDLVIGQLRRARAAGAFDLVAQANSTMTELAMRTGRWSEAYGLMRSTIEDEDWGVPGERAVASGFYARVCAALGKDAECRTAAEAALGGALLTGVAYGEVSARSALGLLELGAGRPEAALVHFDLVQSIFDSSGVVDPGMLWWQGDQLDALIDVGDTTRAEERLSVLEAQAERTGRRYARTAAARARAQLVDPSESERFFAESIENATALGSPFELARTHHARAQHRARHGRAGADRDANRAIALFESLGAAAWLKRATDHPSTSALLAADRLTPSELRVAMAVARGLTNRQAATELHLSTRTVNFYLQSIYRKLEVRTRTEMARRLLDVGTTR